MGVSTQSSKIGDAVEAEVITPALAHAVVRGVVSDIRAPLPPDGRAALRLQFTSIEIHGKRRPIFARVTDVDNARESVDPSGQIEGILDADTVAARLDAGIGQLAQDSSLLAGILSGVKDAILQPPSLDITYAPGVEMTLRLDPPIDIPLALDGLRAMPHAKELAQLVARQPARTLAPAPPVESDVVNLMFLAEERDLRRAFADAGWTSAGKLDARGKLATALALAEERGYREAPLSTLLLENRAPDLEFEKSNNTIAKRHHLRIWRRANQFEGKPVWLAAATHDTAIAFSESSQTFIHQIDSRIDLERQKIVDDLRITGRVRSVDFVERPAVPTETHNATGDQMTTDGRLAVVWIR